MAWNRPTEKPRVVSRSSTRSPWVLICIGTAAVSLVICFFLHPTATSKDGIVKSAGKASEIPEAYKTSRSAPRQTSPAANRARKPASSNQPLGPTNKVVLTKNVKPPTVLGCNYYECVSGGRPLFTKPVFSNSAENIIGGLLSSKPGERFVDVELGEDFDNDFVESMKVPIIVDDGDTDETAALKEGVLKAKQGIAEQMKAGLKPSEVIMSMRDEMNKVADYRDLLQEDFDKIKETGTATQIEAYLKEANQLLDEFGADHLDLPDDEIEEINKRLEVNPNEVTENSKKKD